MKQAIIFIFSGTGNTAKIANEYKRIFAEHWVQTQIVDVCRADPKTQDLTQFDYVGFAYPVYGFNPPPTTMNFVKKLNRCENKKYFILKTSGEPLKLNNASSLKMSAILKRKAFVLTNECHYIMPYNIIFRHSDAMAYKMWSYAQRLCKLDVEEILNGVERKIPKAFGGRLMSCLCRIEYPAFRVLGRLMRVDKKKCNKCRLCINNCQLENITEGKDGFPKFGGKCVLCTKCAFYCPKNAVKMGLFNKWKVNGKYTFEKPDIVVFDKHDNYCKKAYDRYYREADQRLEYASQKNKDENLC